MINIFFDMDGTLIDSANALSSSVNQIRKQLNLVPLLREKILEIINTPNINWAKELYNMDEADHCKLENHFEKYFIRNYEQNVVVFEGIIELLQFLKEKKCFLAIATNAPQNSIHSILQRHNIISYFDKILGVSKHIKPKPHPQMLHLLMNEAPYNKSIFIGDSQKDKECAKNANITYFHARWYEKYLGKNEFNNTEQLRNFLKKYL